MRTPQAFLSSTLIGLRYVREPTVSFLQSFGWSSVAFEENDIVWTPGMQIDENCLQSVDSCDALILILGKHYGRSEAEYAKFKRSISITEAEYQRAIEKHLYIYSFVEEDVLHDYRLWEQNGFSADFKTETDLKCLELLRTIRVEALKFPIIGFKKAGRHPRIPPRPMVKYACVSVLSGSHSRRND